MTDPELRGLLAAAVETARDDYREALASTIQGQDNLPVWERLRRNLGDVILLAYLMGAERATGTLEKAEKSKFARTDLETEGIDELFLSTTFEAGPFQEGIADLTGRVALTREAVDELASLSRGVAQDILADERANIVDRLDSVSRGISEGLRKAFWVSDVDPDTVVVVQDIIADALRGVMPGAELSLPDFIDETRLAGIQNLTDARLETVFRTNVSTAFNEGRMEILRTPESRDLFPLVEIMEVVDDRTRPTHAIMDGYITTPAEMDRLFLRPPNGFNCRGTFNEITFDQAMDSGWILDDGTPDMQAIRLHNGAQREALVRGGRYPDPGFQKGMIR